MEIPSEQHQMMQITFFQSNNYFVLYLSISRGKKNIVFFVHGMPTSIRKSQTWALKKDSPFKSLTWPEFYHDLKESLSFRYFRQIIVFGNSWNVCELLEFFGVECLQLRLNQRSVINYWVFVIRFDAWIELFWFFFLCGCSFQWGVSTGSWSKGCKPMDVWGQLLQYTWHQFWNIWLLRFWSWLGMQARIWRWRGSHPDTCSWLSGEMRNLTPSSKGPLLVVV